MTDNSETVQPTHKVFYINILIFQRSFSGRKIPVKLCSTLNTHTLTQKAKEINIEPEEYLLLLGENGNSIQYLGYRNKCNKTIRVHKVDYILNKMIQFYIISQIILALKPR